jgi:hypothetical protein
MWHTCDISYFYPTISNYLLYKLKFIIILFFEEIIESKVFGEIIMIGNDFTLEKGDLQRP